MRRLPLLLALIALACGESGHDHADHGHDDHAHAPKLGGELVELGDHEFQIEFVLDSATGALAAHLFDGHRERAVPSTMKSLTVRATVGDEEIEVVLEPVVSQAAGETGGKSSEYAGVSEKLRNVEHFEGVLATITLAGKTFENVSFHYHPGGGEHDH